MEFRWIDAESGGEHKKGIHVGKVAPHEGCLLIGYGGKETKVKKYQVLCGDASQLRWVECEGSALPVGWTPVEGGRESDGKALFIAKAHFKGGQQIGKAGEHLKSGMSFGFDGKEVNAPQYSVLAYNLQQYQPQQQQYVHPQGYGAPPPAPGGYGAPAPGYGAPPPPAPAPGGYGAPAPGYGAPAPAPGGYGAPPPPAGGYGQGGGYGGGY